MYSEKWNNYFMNIAKETAKLSKDPNTKVGAVLVKDKRILSVGYNGAPQKFPDDEIPNKGDSSELINQKNSYMIHAELNAVLNYPNSIKDLKDSILYVTISPCHECAKMLSQIGISKVIYLEKYHRKNYTDVSDLIFEKCGIETQKFDSDINVTI